MNQYHKIQTVFKRDPETNYKTLLENEYSLPEFEYLKDCKWVWTEKVDGTNIRVMFDNKQIIFGGKTNNAQIPSFLVNRLNEMFLPQVDKFKEEFREDGPGVCLYGEGYGAKIQGVGGNYRADQSFVLIDIRIGSWWLKREDVENIANTLGIEIVPIIGSGTLKEMVEKTRKGFDSQWGPFKAEGIVARPETELQSRSGQRIITKIKCKDFT